MKFSHVRPPVAKPTKGELLARVEMLSRRSRSVKRKTPDSLEKGFPAWGKVPRLGTSLSSPSTHARVQGQVSLPPAKVPKAPRSQLCSGSAAKAKDSSRKAVEPPFEVMPIKVWSPPAQSAEPPPSRAEELGRKRFEVDKSSHLVWPTNLCTNLETTHVIPTYNLNQMTEICRTILTNIMTINIFNKN